MKFKRAFKLVIGHEGGYVNNPNDPGGETKYGISKRSYPDEDIAGMTLERAKEIYKRDYWDKVRGDELPGPVDFLTFDAAVNSGVGSAARWLQQAVGVADDGKVGPLTLAAVYGQSRHLTAARMSALRLRFMTKLSTWRHFGRGWARRIADNLLIED